MIGYLLRTEEEAVYTHACLEVYHYPLCPLMYVPWYLSQVRRQLHPPAVRLIWGWGRIEVLRVRGGGGMGGDRDYQTQHFYTVESN